MMMNVYARQIMIVSFVVASVLGASFVFAFWMDQSIAIGATRSALFVVILACVHLAGYLLYVRQFADGASTPDLVPSTSSGDSLQPFLKLVLIQQLPLLLLTAQMLDGGRLFQRCLFAALAHWVAIVLIMDRRSSNPSSIDVFMVRWGFFPLAILFFFL